MPGATLQKSVKKQDKQAQAQAVARQILAEPFEIARAAGRQISGGEWTEQTAVEEQQTGGQPAIGGNVENRAADEAGLRAAKSRLDQEVQRLWLERQKEIQAERQREEQEKLQKAQKQEQEKPLLEPVTRKARGMLGGMGAMLGVKRKQRSTELAKTPSN